MCCVPYVEILRLLKLRDIFSLGCRRYENEKRTEWDVKLRRKKDRRTDLNHTTCSLIVPETPEMESENRWKRIDEHLLTRI